MHQLDEKVLAILSEDEREKKKESDLDLPMGSRKAESSALKANQWSGKKGNPNDGR